MRTFTLSLFAAAFMLVATQSVSAQTFCFIDSFGFEQTLTVTPATGVIQGSFLQPSSGNMKAVIGSRGPNNATIRHHNLTAIDPDLSTDAGCGTAAGFVDWLNYTGIVTGNSVPYGFSGTLTNSCGSTFSFSGTISGGACPSPAPRPSAAPVAGSPNAVAQVGEDVVSASRAAEALGVSVHPNPMSDEARISYSLDAATDMRLVVYDVMGRQIATLVDGVQEAGQHTATFDARGLASGTYVYQLSAGKTVTSGQLTLTR